MLPISDFGPDAITQKWINAMKGVAAAENQTAITDYNDEMDTWTRDKAWKDSVNAWRAQQTPAQPPLPLLPRPRVPDLLVVDEAFVAASEVVTADQSTSIDYGRVFIHVPYVAVAPPPQAPPSLVIGDPIIGLPGMYTTKSGDSGSIPAGYQVRQSGHTYQKVLIGPFGSAMWQLVG